MSRLGSHLLFCTT